MMSPVKLLSLMAMIALTFSGCTNSQSEKPKSPSLPGYRVADKPAILATVKDDEQPPVITPLAGSALHAPASFLALTFASHGGGVAYTVGKGDQVYVVHNGRAGSLYKAIGSVALSSDGSRIAYGALVDGKWCMIVDGKAGEPFSTVKDPKFSPDGRHVVYQAMKGDMWYLVVDATVNAGTKKRYRPHEISGDSSRIAYIDNFDDSTRRGRLVVCDIDFKNEHIIDSAVSDMIISADRTAVAAISKNGASKESVIQFNFTKPETITKGNAFDKVDSPVFAPAGTALAYFGERQGKIFCVFNDLEEILPEGMKPVTTVIKQAGKSVGILMSANKTFFLYQMFHNSGRQGKVYDEAEGLVYRSDGVMSAFAARKGNSWFVVLNGTDGPTFDRVVSPKFSPDGKYLVYRARKDGKRFVIVADTSGRILRQLPTYEQVFDVQYTADGKSIAYGVKDGKQLAWKVEHL